jgi:hypothetical protein
VWRAPHFKLKGRTPRDRLTYLRSNALVGLSPSYIGSTTDLPNASPLAVVRCCLSESLFRLLPSFTLFIRRRGGRGSGGFILAVEVVSGDGDPAMEGSAEIEHADSMLI